MTPTISATAVPKRIATSGAIDASARMSSQSTQPAVCSGKPSSAVAIADAWSSGPDMASSAAVLCTSPSAGRGRPDDDDLPAHGVGVEAAALDLAEAQLRDRACRPREVDPGAVGSRGADRVPLVHARGRHGEGVELVLVERHVPQHAVLVVREVGDRGDRAAVLERLTAAEDRRRAVQPDLRRTEDDALLARAHRLEERLVSVRVRARLRELHVVGDDACAGFRELPDNAGMPAPVEREADVRVLFERPVVDPNDHDVRARVGRPADAESRVDRGELDLRERVRRLEDRPDTRRHERCDEQQQHAPVAAGRLHAAPSRIATRNSDSTWNDWSTDAAMPTSNSGARLTFAR